MPNPGQPEIQFSFIQWLSAVEMPVIILLATLMFRFRMQGESSTRRVEELLYDRIDKAALKVELDAKELRRVVDMQDGVLRAELTSSQLDMARNYASNTTLRLMEDRFNATMDRFDRQFQSVSEKLDRLLEADRPK